jgi:hypothetical protein
MIMKTKSSSILVTRSKKKEADALLINLRDFDHRKQLFQTHKLLPESFDKITIEFILQKSKYIRHLIKQLDILLKKGGELEVVLVDSTAHSSSYRSREQVKYEFSVATNGRYRLFSKHTDKGILKLTYTKLKQTLPENDSIDKWSFGIITNGAKNDWVLELINSIEVQKIPKFEIIICGPSPFENETEKQPHYFKIIDDVKLENEIRPPICHKKNKIIEVAEYNNLCILHDRYILPENWFHNFCKYGNYFDALNLKTVDANGNRFGVDWMKFTFPLTNRYKINRTLLFSEWQHEAIIPGGSIVVKKHLITNFMLDERLFWDEMEDMQFSKMAYLNGLLINVDPNNYLISKAVNHKTRKINWFQLKSVSKYIFIRGIVAGHLKYWIIKNKYFKNNFIIRTKIL